MNERSNIESDSSQQKGCNVDHSHPVLSVNALRHVYADRAVLDGFSLTLNRGEHTLLLGPSGSGKTTLINLICGLLTPDDGDITICGEAISKAKGAQRDNIRRRHIGLVPQQVRLVSALTVRENVRLAQKLGGGGDQQRAEDLIEQVGLSERAHAKPRQLSQGEAQRGAIARALVAKPALLIADEPTAALDDANAERVAKLFLDAAKAQGTTLLIATHDARLRPHVTKTINLTPSEASHAC
ncbi:MAG: ABC transporter ATP-binding protein [Pseudomonadota bacterium]